MNIQSSTMKTNDNGNRNDGRSKEYKNTKDKNDNVNRQ